MGMQYQLVSGDSHIDLSWLPGDLFVKSAPARLRDAVPRVVDTKEGPRWMAEGRELGVYGGLGFTFMAPKRGGSARVDRMYESGYYEGRPHPADPELRLKDITLDGVDAEVLYGLSTAATHIKDPETLTAVFRIYNDWVADFCKSRPGRWYGLACIPMHDPPAAARELERAAGLGLRGADLDASVAVRPVYLRDGTWDALWATAAEARMPVSFHIGGDKIKVPLPPKEDPSGQPADATTMAQNQFAYQGARSPLGQLAGAEWLASIVMSGACERHPDFQFVLGESGAGWVPFVLERMDVRYASSYLDRKLDPPLRLMPSQYWYRQGATTFQEDPCVGYLATQIGVDNLMWGSDYPHPDGVWPDSREVIQRTMGGLDQKALRKIVCGNAVKRYRMGE